MKKESGGIDDYEFLYDNYSMTLIQMLQLAVHANIDYAKVKLLIQGDKNNLAQNGFL